MLIPCIPYGTDAPIFHRPIGTLALIALNSAAFAHHVYPQVFGPGVDAFQQWTALVGVMNPLVWITTNFLHGSLIHLLGNMVFLWVFGLVVEGKLGWYLFVPLYLGLGLAQGRLEQIAYERFEIPILEQAGPLDSSAVLYSLAAMALVWAPQNDVRCFSWIWVKAVLYNVPVLAMAVIFVAVDASIVWMAGLPLAAAAVHLSGAALGFVVAALLMLLRVVDCQGWDLFSVMLGRHGAVDLDEMRKYKRRTPADENDGDENDGDDDHDHNGNHDPRSSTAPDEIPESEAARIAAALEHLRGHLQRRDATAALQLQHRMAAQIPAWRMPQSELAALIRLLVDARWTVDAVSLMFEHLRAYPASSAAMRVELGGILLTKQDRPAKAVEVLEGVEPGSLDDALEAARQQLLAEARRRTAEGELELEGDEG